MLDALQAVDKDASLAPANWQPGEALLGQPQADLDNVFAAEGEADWFLGKVGAGARR
jgi:peroxiredoxin (alkyl hydroperoxide reductase subunit C)